MVWQLPRCVLLHSEDCSAVDDDDEDDGDDDNDDVYNSDVQE